MIIYIYIYTIPGSGAKPAGDYPFILSSEVHVIFDGIKTLVFHNNMDEGVYDFRFGYRKIEIKDRIWEWYFTFTPEMYDEAVPIDEQEE